MPTPPVRPYPIDSLSTHPRLQIRGGTDYATIRRYKRDMLAGDVFLPLTLAEIGGKLYVVDGHHRLEASRAAGLHSITGIQRRMSLDEAQREALLALSKHDRSPTTKEKQHAFASYIAEGLHLNAEGNVKPLRTIAAECPVYVFQTVSKKLKELGIDAPREDVGEWSYTGRDNDEITSEDLELEDAIYLGEFNKHLAAASASYGLLTDAGRSNALAALNALKEGLEPPRRYLDI